MKRTIIYLIVLMAATSVWAQHMDFCGVELSGHVRDITEKMRKAGFKLKEKRTDQNFYIFEGMFCGHTTFLNVNFTPKTKTVYQVRVTPRAVNEVVLVDSLVARYGSEFAETEEGLSWATEQGGIFYIKRDNYDPFIIIMDAAGVEQLKEEKK